MMIIFLLVLVGVVSASSGGGDQRFLLSQGTQLITYHGDKAHSTSVPLAWAAASAPIGTRQEWLVAGQGRQRRITVSANASGALLIGPSVDNPLARWRYTRLLNNLSFVLSNEPLPGLASRRSTAAFDCVASGGTAFCTLAPNQPLRLVGGESPTAMAVNVTIDPERARGLLPPAVYFALGRGGGATSASVAGLVLTPADLGSHFGLGTDADGIVVGGTYWRTHFTSYEIDHWTGSVTAIASINAIGISLGTRVAGVVCAALIAIGPYFFLWLTNREAAVSHAADLHRRHHGRPWHTNKRMTMLGFLTLPAFVLGLVFGWLAVVNNGNLTPALPATGIQLYELVILLTAYGGLQALIATACFAYDELPRQQGGWSYPISLEMAWLRNTATSSALPVAIALCFMPTAVAALESGNRAFLIFLHFWLLAAEFHHAYHLPGLIRAVPRHTGGTRMAMAALVQVILLFAYKGGLLWFLLAPTVNTLSAYFDEVANWAAAALLDGVVLLTAFLVSGIEWTVGLRLLTKKLRAIRKSS